MTIGETSFPTNVDTFTELVRAVNLASSNLTAPIDADDVNITVDDASEAPPDGIMWIDQEAIIFTSKSGNTLQGCERGIDSTDATIHAAGAAVYFDVRGAASHNAHSDAIIEIQEKLGSGASTPAAGTFMKGTGVGTSGWAGLTSNEVTTALGFTPAATEAENGLVFIDAVPFTNVNIVTIDNKFTPTYRNYRIIIDLTFVNPSSTGLVFRMRANGVESAVEYYYSLYRTFSTGTTNTGADGDAPEWYLFWQGLDPTADRGVVMMDLFGPQVAFSTVCIAETSFFYLSGTAGEWFHGGHYPWVSYDGFRISGDTGDNISGQVAIYAYRN